MSHVLVFAEHSQGKIKKSTHEILGKASELAATLGGQVIALVLGDALSGLENDLAAYGAQKVVLATSPTLATYNAMAYAQVVSDVIQEQKPSVVLASASGLAKDFLPRVAARLKAGSATDCTGLRIEAGKLVAQKPIYSGKAFADVVYQSSLQIATVRPNSFGEGKAKTGATAEVVIKNVALTEVVNPIVKLQASEGATKTDLTEAEIIVSGGRAMGNAENFKILRELADVLGATVGASRAAVDSGYASHDMQVGQTGKVVNPKLYIACGISGAIQHLAGMRTSKIIVAINKDPDAPIFGKADYGIVGDLFEVVPKLTEEFKKIL